MHAKDCVRKPVTVRLPAIDVRTVAYYARQRGVPVNDLYTALVHRAAEAIRDCRDPITGDDEVYDGPLPDLE